MSTHEDLKRGHDVAGSSNRGFGLTVGGILLAIGAVRLVLHWQEGVGWVTPAMMVIGAVLVLLALTFADVLAPLNVAWTKLGLVMFSVISPVILGLLYFGVFTPFGLVLRATGHDPLRLKFDPDATTYWIERSPPGPDPKTMANQF